MNDIISLESLVEIAKKNNKVWKWVAVDDCQRAYGYRDKPQMNDNYWDASGLTIYFGEYVGPEAWEDTLRKVPCTCSHSKCKREDTTHEH